MNNIDLEELTPADRALAGAARARLRASESLNYVETARLAATRAQIRELMQADRRSAPAWGWLAAPVAIAAIAFSVLRPSTAPHVPAAVTAAAPTAPSVPALPVNDATADALMWVSDEAGPEFYQDLEFYQWLQSRPPTEPSA